VPSRCVSRSLARSPPPTLLLTLYLPFCFRHLSPPKHTHTNVPARGQQIATAFARNCHIRRRTMRGVRDGVRGAVEKGRGQSHSCEHPIDLQSQRWSHPSTQTQLLHRDAHGRATAAEQHKSMRHGGTCTQSTRLPPPATEPLASRFGLQLEP
jgi:hypothetical protein